MDEIAESVRRRCGAEKALAAELATDTWRHFGEGNNTAGADFSGRIHPPAWATYPGN